MNDDETNFQYSLEAMAEPFLVHGHKVILFSPAFAQVIIKCSFARSCAASEEQKEFVLNQTQSVVTYLLTEGILPRGEGLGIMVLTSHPQSLN